MVLNSRSLADFVLGFESPGDDEISLEKWPIVACRGWHA
jgi:hypothetical protein